MTEPPVEVSQDLGSAQPHHNMSIASGDGPDKSTLESEVTIDRSLSEKSDGVQEAVSKMDEVLTSARPSCGATEKGVKSSLGENIDDPVPQETDGSKNNTAHLDGGLNVSCDKKNSENGATNDTSGDINVDVNHEENCNMVDLKESYDPEHYDDSCNHYSRTRSLSEGSSGSEDECRRMEISHLESDTGSSSISPRDQASSEASSDDPLADLETLRQCAGSAMSDVSSYSWMREGTMGSMISVDPDSALGRIRADIAALGSAKNNNQTGITPPAQAKKSNDLQPNSQLTNELVEGPTLTLPPEESLPSKSHATTATVGEVESGVSVAEVGLYQAQVAVDTTNNASDKHMSEPASLSRTNGATPSDHSSDVLTSQSSCASVAVKPQPVDEDSNRITPTHPATPVAPAKPRVKKTPNDFIFGKVIGEGSYSTVYLAKEVATQKEFAIKICEKKHLIRERKTHFVMREKEVFMKLDHPFFVRLAYTFQDSERLYYVLTYARNGELLGYLHKLSAFDVPCTRFYTAEIILALEYLHSLGIIHRDLKPENILLSEDMHIKITDFGTSKVLQLDDQGKPVPAEQKKKNSFVGTAEYVSPEVLNNEPANFGSDLWAFGCIIYQCLSGSMPFKSGNEYQTFQKIVKAEYTFPEGFNEGAKDLVKKLLVLDPKERLGMPGTGGMPALKSHKFYTGLDWDSLPSSTPPKLMPYLPATSHNPEFWGQDHRVGFDDQRLAEIITGQSNADGSLSPELDEVAMRGASPVDIGDDKPDQDAIREERLEKQRRENQFHQYVEGNLILKQGFVDKRKGLFARKRMLLLTEGPHLYYVDAHHKVLKGEIPWSRHLRPEAKNFRIFFVHTPNRTYYLESRMPDAQMWVKKIKEVWRKYYGSLQEDHN